MRGQSSPAAMAVAASNRTWKSEFRLTIGASVRLSHSYFESVSMLKDC